MEAGPIKLLKLLGENKNTFNIPVYQRNYEWNKEQVEQFFKDIVNIIEDNYEIRHFLGTVVFVSNEKPGLMMERIIIDGQQRITTTILLLKAIYDLLDENDGFKNEIYETYIINKYVEDEYKLKLKPVEGDMQAFVDLMNESPTIKESKIFTNYSLFVDLIERSNYSAREIYEALSLVEIVYISLDRNSKKENPQIIFESLNSTGLSLTEADLIRNFILMGLSYDEQTRLYKKYWLEIEKMLPNVKISEFVRDYLTMKTGHTPNKNKVYFEFKKNYFKNSYTSENILKDLLKYARYYYWFINVNTNDNEINKWLEKLNYMKSTVVYPYLLELFDDYFQKKNINKEELIQTLKLINSYLYRRSICNIPSNALNKVFAAMTKHVSKLKKEKEYSHIESVIEYLMTRKNRGIFPRDAEFKKSFIELDIYNRRDLALFTLYTIEESIHRETVEMNDLTIEHIMPQVLTPKWSIDLGKEADEIHKMYKDTIGNLTLTKYNEEISNKSFEEKKIYYTESNIKITRDIAEYDKWDRESIIQRANELFEIAKEIWKVPEDKYSDLSPEELQPGQEYSIMDSLKVTGYKPNSLIIDNETIPVSSWKELLKKTCIYLIELDTELFYSLLNNNNFKKLISKNKADLRRPEALTNDIYLEVNLSAKDILNYIKLLTKEYEIEEDIYFTIRY